MPPKKRINQRQTDVQIARREKILRYIESRGGVIEILMPDLAAATGLPVWSLREDLPRLEQYGVLEIKRRSEIGKGSLPTRFRVLKACRWFLEHADELEQARRRRAQTAGVQVRKMEEQRVRERDAKQTAAAIARNEARARRKKGLPSELPPPGEPEPKTVPVSEKLVRELIREGLALPSEELAAWGA